MSGSTGSTPGGAKRVLGLEEGNFGGGYIGFGSEQAQVGV
jgi:hypothetical protein